MTDRVTDIHKPPEPEKKGILTKAKEIISPPKTEAQLRESFMIKKWKLMKDLRVPHRYWLDDQTYITFIPGDEESVRVAEERLEAHFRAPQIERATGDVSARSPYLSKSGKSGGKGIMDQIADAVEPMARQANRASGDMFSGGFGFDPRAAEKELMSLDGVEPVQKVGYRDFVPDGSVNDRGSPSGQPAKKKKSKKKTGQPDDDFGLSGLNPPRDDEFLR